MVVISNNEWLEGMAWCSSSSGSVVLDRLTLCGLTFFVTQQSLWWQADALPYVVRVD